MDMVWKACTIACVLRELPRQQTGGRVPTWISRRVSMGCPHVYVRIEWPWPNGPGRCENLASSKRVL